MASLKDMRVRIAATKATQKITKAMQMVAASKLRRAQVAAEAARPFAERMEKVLGNIAASVDRPRIGAEAARRHRKRSGASAGGLHRRARPVRAVQFGDRAAGARAHRALTDEGKQVKIFCVGRKGYEQLRRNYEKQIVEVIELRGVKNVGFENAEAIAEKIIERFEKGEFDVATLFFSRFKSVIAQIPTALQMIPPVFPDKAASDDRRTRLTNTSRTRSTFSASCCRAISPCRCSARCWKTPRPNRARA